jgi:hypothetical protein
MDEYRLMTQAEYAAKCGKSRAIINYYVKRGYLNTEIISGIPHVKVPLDLFEKMDHEEVSNKEKLKSAWNESK